MPLYNKRPYARRAIDSVRHQTFTNWELIIVDDGSTDGSIAEVPKDEPRIRTFRQSNLGPAAARNRGSLMASGKYVTFLDADDYYYPQKLEKEMLFLSKERMAEWMISAHDVEEVDETKFVGCRDINGKQLEGEALVFDRALEKLSLHGLHVDGICMDRQLLESLGGFNEDMRCFEIYEFIIRCALEKPRVIVYNKALYRVVKVPDSAFTVLPHWIEGLRQMGESFYKLSTHYREFSPFLIEKSKKNLFSHVSALIASQRNHEVRKYLEKEYPYSRDKKWWKYWIMSWLPRSVLSPIKNPKRKTSFS
jgi:glycosyltransferase involved in cell wall biosynthesis